MKSTTAVVASSVLSRAIKRAPKKKKHSADILYTTITTTTNAKQINKSLEYLKTALE